MEQMYKKNGTPINIMTDEDMKVFDIKQYITTNEMYTIEDAYCSCGVIYINILIQKNVVGEVNDIPFINDSRFYPHTNAFGICSYPSIPSDFGKIMYVYINSIGELCMWIYNHLDYNERVTFIYPLKS